MSYRLKSKPEIQKELKRLPSYVRAQAIAAIDALANTPRPSGAKELEGKPSVYRVWLAGRWRIVYQIDDATSTVTILRVRRKEDIDYDSIAPDGAAS